MLASSAIEGPIPMFPLPKSAKMKRKFLTTPVGMLQKKGFNGLDIVNLEEALTAAGTQHALILAQTRENVQTLASFSVRLRYPQTLSEPCY